MINTSTMYDMQDLYAEAVRRKQVADDKWLTKRSSAHANEVADLAESVKAEAKHVEVESHRG